jgi:hypothetical protein
METTNFVVNGCQWTARKRVADYVYAQEWRNGFVPRFTTTDAPTEQQVIDHIAKFYNEPLGA